VAKGTGSQVEWYPVTEYEEAPEFARMQVKALRDSDGRRSKGIDTAEQGCLAVILF